MQPLLAVNQIRQEIMHHGVADGIPDYNSPAIAGLFQDMLPYPGRYVANRVIDNCPIF